MDGVFRQIARLRAAKLLLAGTMLAVATVWAAAADICQVVLVDGERSEALNNWGGAWGQGNVADLQLQDHRVHSGRRALRVDIGPQKAGDRFFFQCFPSGFGATAAYHQTRDLTRYERFSVYLYNETGAPLTGVLQIKDYRDSTDHCAIFEYSLPAEAGWTRIEAPLTFDRAPWKLTGQPDLSRVFSLDFIVQTPRDIADGALYLDDFVVVEPGGPVDSEKASHEELTARIARRQWDALWSARSREHGLIPNTSYQATDAALNATSGVVWMLPAAVRRGWVTKHEADAYMELLVRTLDRLLDDAKYLPPRNVDWVTLQPSLLPEESSVDAAFLAVGLHQYKSQPDVSPTLRETIHRTQNRFNFAAFAVPHGWRMAYRRAVPPYAEGFTEVTYDGYTNEGNIVSLAAHLSQAAHVPIETHWNSSPRRSREGWTGDSPVVHSWPQFRAPFTQALLNLFVDVRGYGADRYPNPALATNPWQNFVCYEQAVMARLAALGRPHLVQPDAGDDGSLGNYQQFSLYENFGQGDLFMPWSAAFPLLAQADGAAESLRFLLSSGLHGPLGLADSAKWRTGEPAPYAVTARHDFWNTALSTMALLEGIDGDARLTRSFTALPETRAALDRVFLPVAPAVEGETTVGQTPASFTAHPASP